MENKELEKICGILNIPSIPKKEWNGKESFKDGISVIELIDGTETYAISTFNKEEDKEPRIKRVFSTTPFIKAKKHYPIPIYMNTDVDDFDLSDEDKEKAKGVIDEAKEKEKEKTEEKVETSTNEYYFDEIHSDEEAKAFIKSYNKKNGITGRVPQTHENILMRLNVIYHNKKK